MRALGILIGAALLGVLLVPSLIQWWQQEQDYAHLLQRVQAAEERNAQMREELSLWEDPEYIASQARERLGYVKPGETHFTVVDPGEEHLEESQVLTARDEGPARPWIQVLTITLSAADAVEAAKEPTLTTEVQSDGTQSEDTAADTTLGQSHAQ